MGHTKSERDRATAIEFCIIYGRNFRECQSLMQDNISNILYFIRRMEAVSMKTRCFLLILMSFLLYLDKYDSKIHL